MDATEELLLNSNSQIHFSISGSTGRMWPSDESLGHCIHVYFDFLVHQTYKSSDGSNKILNDQIRSHASPGFPYELLMSEYDGTPSSPSWGVVSGIISDLNLPFQVENVKWKGAMYMYDEEQGRAYETQAELLENHDDFIRHILDYTRLRLPKLFKFGLKVLEIRVSMDRIVILPRCEIEAMERARRMEERVNSLNGLVSLMTRSHDSSWSFNWIRRSIAQYVRDTAPPQDHETLLDKNYERNLMRSLIRRAIRELADRDIDVSSTILMPATNSSIEALDKVTFEGGEDSTTTGTELCPICRDQIMVGSEVTTMPCSHIYHPKCIVKWLKRSHMCPLCRFKLSTS